MNVGKVQSSDIGGPLCGGNRLPAAYGMARRHGSGDREVHSRGVNPPVRSLLGQGGFIARSASSQMAAGEEQSMRSPVGGAAKESALLTPKTVRRYGQLR